MGYTFSATATPSGTASITPSPSGTETQRYPASLFYGGFLLVVIGNATLQVAATGQKAIPATVQLYNDCGPDCTSPDLQHTYAINSAFGGDAYTPNNRAFTVSGDSSVIGTGAVGATTWVSGFSTYHQGRVVISDDQMQVTLAGFDVWGNWPLTAKREPSMWRLDYTGAINVTTPCKKINTGSGSLINSPYYW